MKLLVTKTAAKQLLKIPYHQRLRIEKRIEELAKKPFTTRAKKLSGRSGWRLRIGDCRALYSIDKKKKLIIILSVQHRKDAYKIKL